MLKHRQVVQNRAIRLASLVAAPLFGVLAVNGYFNDTLWVMWGNLLGMGLVWWTAYQLTKTPDSEIVVYPLAVYLACFLALMAWSDYQGGVGLIWLVACPALAIMLLGSRIGLGLSVAFFALLVYRLLFDDLVSESIMSYPVRLRFVALFVVVGMICLAYSLSTDWYEGELEAAQRQITDLQSLLPICSYCKDIRSDDGKWQPIESYFSEQKDVNLSHGICESCLQKNWP